LGIQPQGRRLFAGGRQREHQPAVHGLVQRVFVAERPQRADDPFAVALSDRDVGEGDRGGDPPATGCHGGRMPAQPVVGVGDDRSAPARQRLREQGRGLPGLSGRAGGLGLRHEIVEPVQVKVLSRQGQAVAAPGQAQAAARRTQQRAQITDAGLDQIADCPGRIVTPHHVDDVIGLDHLTVVQRQQTEHGPLPQRRYGSRLTVTNHLQWAEHTDARRAGGGAGSGQRGDQRRSLGR
jgi:hypothetical protein